MTYSILKEKGYDNDQQKVKLPSFIVAEVMYLLGNSVVSPGVEKLSPIIHIIDTLLHYRTYYEDDVEYNVLTHHYGSRYKKARIALSETRKHLAITESYLRGLRDKSIKHTDINNKRFFEWQKSCKDVEAMRPFIFRMRKLLIENTNIEDQYPESKHYSVAGHTVKEMHYNLKEDKKEEHSDSRNFDSEGTQVTDKYISEKFV